MNKDDKKLYNELKARLPIDQYNLEVECRNQSILLTEVGEIASEIKRAYKENKEHIEFVRADLSTKIRKDPEKYGIVGKVTSDTVVSAVIIQSEYRKAISASLDAEEAYSSFSELLIAVEGRKSLIRDLVTLFVREYYDSKKLLDESQAISNISEAQIVNDRARRAEELKEREKIGEVEE